MKNKNRKLFLLTSFMFILSPILYSKGANDTKEIPLQVQDKISTYNESNKSWYITTFKDKGSVMQLNEVLYGPLENRQQAMLIWLYLELPENKKFCLARNMAFVTKAPINYYRNDNEILQKEIKKEGFIPLFEKYFDVTIPDELTLNTQSSQKNLKDDVIVKTTIEIDPVKVENKEIKEENINDDKETISTEDTYIESPNKINESSIEKEINKEEIDSQLEENKIDIKIENKENPPETKNEDIISQENIETKETEEIKKTEEIKEVKEAEIKVINEEKNNIESELNEEKKSENEKSKFELTINSEKSNSSAYAKEFLQDYAPKKKIKLPEDEFKSIEFEIEDPNASDEKGVTLLMKAAKNGNNWEIDNLIEKGADINKKDNQGWTALMYACRYQESSKIVEKLINSGAKIKEKNDFLLSALNLASVYNGNPEILGLLLLRYLPSDTDVLNSLIMLLSDNSTNEFSKIAKIKIFISKKVPLNTFYNGKTPLMYAAEFGNSTKVIKLLIESGAVTTIRSTEGKTAFDYAQKNSNLEEDESYWLLNK